MITIPPGFKTSEGILSTLAAVLAGLVAMKWVPINVSVALQADAVKAIPLITGLYAIARGITKIGKPAVTPTSGGTAPATLPPSEADQAPGL